MKTIIPLFEGSEIKAELSINEDKGYLKYFFKDKEIKEESIMESIHPKVFDIFVFISRGICSENNAILWSY